MPRFFIDADLHADAVLLLPEELTRHIQVLRLVPGDPIMLFNGQGGQYAARLVDIGRRGATAHLGKHEATEAEPPYTVTLAQGIAGGGKMDWLIEKAVELGVARVVPLVTNRGVVRLTSERAAQRQAHWLALVQAACEQCGRNRVPQVQAPGELNRWLIGLPPSPAAGELRLMLSPRAHLAFGALPDAAPPAGVTLLVGPEGGLSPEEETAALEAGFTALSLGPRVLRTETAGIAFLAALAARWGGW